MIIKTIQWLLILECLQFIFMSQQQQCVVVKNDIFDHCIKSTGVSFNVLLSKQVKNSTNSTDDMHKDNCTYEPACRKTFKISYLRRQLYTLSLLKFLVESLEECCGSCAQYTVINTIHNIKDISKSVLNNSDIIFPLLATKSTKRLYGFHYIPVIKVPSAYYFTLTMTNEESIVKLLLGIQKNWPLLVICLLLSLISGFVIWLLERKVNRVEFPKQYCEGLWEGFWWSFISMTTVGYGDKTPRSCKGRLYAIVWILIGITLFALLTGSLTNQIKSIQTPVTPDLLGKRVGGLEHKFHEATLIAQHGGFLIGLHFNDTVRAIATLIERLERKEIDGFLISRVSYYYFKDSIRNKSEYKDVAERVKNVRMDITEKDFIKEPLTQGILIKNLQSYDYLKAYFEDNWHQIQNCEMFRLNKKADLYALGDNEDQFRGLIAYFVYAIISILGFIAAFGVYSKFRIKFCTLEKDIEGENSEHLNVLTDMLPI